jgi:hypothetical protein
MDWGSACLIELTIPGFEMIGSLPLPVRPTHVIEWQIMRGGTLR